MTSREKVSFSSKKMLALPIVFAIVFAVLPKVGSAIPAFVAATAMSGIACFVNRKNGHRIVIAVIGCMLGILFALYESPRRGLDGLL